MIDSILDYKNGSSTNSRINFHPPKKHLHYTFPALAYMCIKSKTFQSEYRQSPITFCAQSVLSYLLIPPHLLKQTSPVRPCHCYLQSAWVNWAGPPKQKSAIEIKKKKRPVPKKKSFRIPTARKRLSRQRISCVRLSWITTRGSCVRFWREAHEIASSLSHSEEWLLTASSNSFAPFYSAATHFLFVRSRRTPTLSSTSWL